MTNVGIDIGGTKVNIGLVDEAGKVLARARLETEGASEARELVERISQSVNALLQTQGMGIQDVGFIGAGVPGTVDTDTGLVSYCPNLQWFDEPVGEYFQQALGRRVPVAQDSRNGALAEKLFGAGKPYSDLILITIGTGIGCGIVLGGKVFGGGMNTAGELGHSPILKNGVSCLCGNKGCLERYVSGTGILERALAAYPDRFQQRPRRCETVFELAYQGDREMLELIDQCMDDLAFAIANAVSLLSPQAVIISGGLSEHEELVITPLEEKIYAHGYYAWTRLKRLQVHKALLGGDAPMIGAASLYLGR